MLRSVLDRRSCAAPPATYDVTFRVDMSTYEAGYGTVNLNGSFNGWCGGCTEMTDNDGDMVYEVTVALAEGTFESSSPRTDGLHKKSLTVLRLASTIDGYNNRSDVAEAVLDVVCWNSCEACGDPRSARLHQPKLVRSLRDFRRRLLQQLACAWLHVRERNQLQPVGQRRRQLL